MNDRQDEERLSNCAKKSNRANSIIFYNRYSQDKAESTQNIKLFGIWLIELENLYLKFQYLKIS